MKTEICQKRKRRRRERERERQREERERERERRERDAHTYTHTHTHTVTPLGGVRVYTHTVTPPEDGTTFFGIIFANRLQKVVTCRGIHTQIHTHTHTQIHTYTQISKEKCGLTLTMPTVLKKLAVVSMCGTRVWYTCVVHV